jgi:hypothetical protein
LSDKSIEFIPSGRGKPQCAPNPRYPHGMAVPAPAGCTRSCHVDLPYPAPECGMYIVRCSTCGFSAAITAAGRPDDAVSVELPCDGFPAQTEAVQ